MRNCCITAALLVTCAQPAAASEAEICYTTPVAFQNSLPPTNSTIFNCPISGAKTLPQLAAEGWEIVQLSPISVAGGSQISDQLVIQRRR